MTLLRWHWMAIGLVAAVASGCSSGSMTGPNCNDPLGRQNSLSVVVTVRDLTTSALVLDSASGTIHGTSPSDTLLHDLGSPGQLFGSGPPGTYAVSVSRPGYGTWSQAGIVVPVGYCGGPSAVDVIALLVPSP